MPESLKLLVTPSVWPETPKVPGAVVSKTQLTRTISDVLPASSQERTQMILAPSPVTSKDEPMPRVQVAPWSKENSQLISLATSQMPLPVMPSVTLKPVSLKDKTGGLRTTEAVTGAEAVLVESKPAVSGPAPPQALKKIAMASTPAGLDRDNERRRYNMKRLGWLEKVLM
jgi:hypothetical protein